TTPPKCSPRARPQRPDGRRKASLGSPDRVRGRSLTRGAARGSMNGIEASNPLESVVGMLANQVATAFEWLADGVPRSTPVSFFPNPGNVGDAAINLACRRFLSARFDAVEICTPATTPAHTHVFFG